MDLADVPAPAPSGPKPVGSVASRPPRGRSRRRRPPRTPPRGERRARQPGGPRQTAAVNPPRAYLILVGTAAAVIVAAGIGAAARLIGPAFLAWVIVVVIAPVGRRLRGAWLATAVLVVRVYGVVGVMAGVVVVSAARLATVLPQYAAEADGLRRGLGTLLATYGIGPDQVRAVLADLDIGK